MQSYYLHMVMLQTYPSLKALVLYSTEKYVQGV